MHRSTLFAAAGLAALAMTSGAWAQGGRPLATTMNGAEEAPGPGDPDGSGEFFMTMNQGQGVICYEIVVRDILLPAIAAHIHEAPVGEPGPVVVPLNAPDEEGLASGCVEVDPEEIKEIRQHPEEYYVNVHTTDFPAGAVRGQLAK